MPYHYFPAQPHAAHDESEFAVAMCRLVQVHKIHIDLIPGNVSVELGMPDLLNGVMVLKGTVSKVVIENAQKAATISNPFVAIPYYAWANRGKGEMTLWFPEKLNYLTIN